MRGWTIALALGVLVTAAPALADEETKSTADQEIEESKAALAESQAQTAPPLERGTPPYKPSIMPWILGGAGIAAMITGGVFALVSLSDSSKSDDFEKLAQARTNPNEQNDLLAQAEKSDDRAKTNMTIGLVSGGAGVALLGAGIVWAIVDGPPKENEKAARVTPWLGTETAGLSLSSEF